MSLAIGSLSPTERHGLSSGPPDLAWHCPGHCEHLGRELADKSLLFLSLFSAVFQIIIILKDRLSSWIKR